MKACIPKIESALESQKSMVINFLSKFVMGNVSFFVLSITKIILLLFFITINNNSFSQEVVCMDCHENLISKTVHDKILKCSDCHKDIIADNHQKGSALKVNCANCHAALNKQMNNDVHRNIMKVAEKNAPNCKSCHGTHQIKSTITIQNKQQVFCSKCHKNDVLKISYHTSNDKSESCNNCHIEKLHKTLLLKSVHSKLSCSNCHSYVFNNLSNHKKTPKEGVLTDCYLCHNSIAKEHKESIHGLSISEGINEAAQCWDCHGSHSIEFVSNKKSLVYPTNLVKTCGRCHDDPKITKKYSLAIKNPSAMYSKSVHGIIVAKDEKAASCITCHGSHDIKNRVQVGSKISSLNIPNTCENCHKKIVDEYKQSIHWIGVKKGIRESPSCNDCHSEHSIHAINSLNKREEIRRMQSQTCLECHQNLLLSERYGLSNQSAGNYQDSYHGLAVSRNDKNAAMCVDCHEVHKILPKESPESSTNKNNVVATCKKCHKEADVVFANSYSHVSQVKSALFIENIVRSIYFWLIVFVIGFMMLHNALILYHELIIRFKKSRTEIRISRFTKNELIQHTILLSSFIILAITGFQLKYPNSVFGKVLFHLGFDEVIRQLVHRISAVVMTGLSIYHAVYLIATSRGRDVLKGLFPKSSDFSQAYNNVMYYLHLKKKQPEFYNYNYIEKLEYWALIWGTIVMGVTGLILWFPTIVGTWAPVWLIKVSQIVHFYEAILATLAIIIWHWFFVIFRPKEYPLNFTCVDGKMPVLHYKEEHKLTYFNMIAEWFEVKNGKKKKNKLSHFTKLFMKSMERNDILMESFVNGEVNNDKELELFLKEKKLL